MAKPVRPINQAKAESQADAALRRQQAGNEIITLLLQHYLTTLCGHPGTLLSAAGWLAGTSLYRSFNFKHDIPPGSIILSEQANQAGPAVMNTFQYAMQQVGFTLGPDELVFQFPEEHKPRKTILEVQEALQGDYNRIMRLHGFDYAQAAQLGAMACAPLVKQFCPATPGLSPGLAAGLVAMGLVAGSKTSPVPLK